MDFVKNKFFAIPYVNIPVLQINIHVYGLRLLKTTLFRSRLNTDIVDILSLVTHR